MKKRKIAASPVREMEVALSAAGATTPHLVCSSPCDIDDVSDDVTADVMVEAVPRCSPAALSGDTPPPSSPTPHVDDVKPRLLLLKHHRHRDGNHRQQQHHHSDTLSPHPAASQQQQQPTRTRCSLDVASIVATDNTVTLLDNRYYRTHKLLNVIKGDIITNLLKSLSVNDC